MIAPQKNSSPRGTLFVAVAGLCISVFLSTPASAQRGLRDIPPPDVEKQLATFKVLDGFEVNLFAADPMVTKPIQMNFDSAGRLWVVSSPLYPHIAPGDKPRDRVIVLEDRDGDGKADSHRIFADGLLMPTGLEIGDGGVYVANSEEILHLADTDGDGVADRRRVVLSGFGTEDTHHLIHTFRWGHDGNLYFNQSIYIHSHIETPYGVRRLDGGGVWQFRPDALRLEVFMYGMCNPWGHHFDYWGQNIGTDGAGFEGVQYLIPGSTCRHSPRRAPVLPGLNPGSPKYCGAEFVTGRHLPPEWNGRFVTNDFRANRVSVFELSDDGSGYRAKKLDNLLHAQHVAFRPVDVKQGPDGAIYIADWYNPIIQHGEVGFRDKRRDHDHGRIWRITAKGRKTLKNPRVDRMNIPQLLGALRAPEQWTRHFAKRELYERSHEQVLPTLKSWIADLKSGDEDYDHALVEALWVYQTLDVVDEAHLKRVLAAKTPQARTSAIRVVGEWHKRLENPVALLGGAVVDDYPRARLEAVRALGKIGGADSAVLATAALSRSMDSWLDYSLALTLRETQNDWVPALRRGDIDFGGDTRRLEFALSKVGSPDVASPLLKIASTPSTGLVKRTRLLELVTRIGGPKELQEVLKLTAQYSLSSDSAAFPAAGRLATALRRAAIERGVRPAGGFEQLEGLFASCPAEAYALVGAWGMKSFRPRAESAAVNPKEKPDVRRAALAAIADLGGERGLEFLSQLAAGSSSASVPALESLVRLSAERAAGTLLSSDSTPKSDELEALVRAFTSQKNGAATLAKALQSHSIDKDSARVGIRSALAANENALADAFREAGKLGSGDRIGAAEREQLLERIARSGDPSKGQFVFERRDLRCVACHSLGGAGGRVGPDLSTIGASAQIDYILDSILDPRSAVKEGYHAVTVVTNRGQVLSGVRIRQNKEGVSIRTGEDQEIFVPARSAVQVSDAPSMMPEGLYESMTRTELVDLVAFLSRLGKGDEYSLPKEPYFRTWSLLTKGDARLAGLPVRALGTALTQGNDLTWGSSYSRIGGEIRIPKGVSFARSAFDVTTPGRVRIESSRKGQVWIDGQPLGDNGVSEPLQRGRHEVILSVDEESLRVRLVDAGKNSAGTRVILGK
ncbi:MAG: PVC-type heme-binding CxxCH protein [Planctomycetota bacterium]